MRAAPRQAISPASVTTSEGNPSLVITPPCRRPTVADTSSAITTITPNGRPLRSWRAATMHAAKPITEATDRSISPEMITNVMAMTTMIFSIESSNRLTKLSTLR